MKELKEERIIFLHSDGSVWFDLTEDVRKFEIYRIRCGLGGNDGIHKINEYELS